MMGKLTLARRKDHLKVLPPNFMVHVRLPQHGTGVLLAVTRAGPVGRSEEECGKMLYTDPQSARNLLPENWSTRTPNVPGDEAGVVEATTPALPSFLETGTWRGRRSHAPFYRTESDGYIAGGTTTASACPPGCSGCSFHLCESPGYHQVWQILG